MNDYGEYDPKELKKLQGVLLDMLDDFNKLCKKHKIDYFVLDGTGIGAVRHDGFIPWDDDIDVRMLRKDYEEFIKYAEKEYGDKYYLKDYSNDKKYPYNFAKWCKKNTRFIDDNSDILKLDIGLFIDIYVIDYVPDDSKKRNKLLKRAWIMQKIGLLSVIKNPVIQGRGIKQSIIRFCCKMAYYFLKLFKVSPSKMYKKAEDLFVPYNNKTKTLAYAFETTPYLSIYDIDDIYPLKKHKFNDTYVYLPNNYDKLLRDYFGDYMQLPPEDKRHNHYPKELCFDTRKK